jgi:hypothetical protein
MLRKSGKKEIKKELWRIFEEKLYRPPRHFQNPYSNVPFTCSLQIYTHFFPWLDSPGRPRPDPCRGFEITPRHTTPGRTPLYEWSTRHRNLYLTTHNTHKRQTFLPPWQDSNPQSQQASGRRPKP